MYSRQQTADIQQFYSGLCTRVYNEIQMNAPGWTKVVDRECDITTWTFQGEKGKFAPPLGSNGQIVVKILGPNSYDYIKTDDFIARGQLICDAIEQIIDKEHPDLKNILHAQLKEYFQKFIDEIKQDCTLDVKKMRSEEREAYFMKRYKLAEKKLNQLLTNASVMLAEATPEKEPKKILGKVLKKIKETEKAVISERGRPTIIKIGQIGKEQMVSAQFTQGKDTVPSSDRRGRYPTKLSNHVMDFSGTCADGKIQFNAMIEGHSSYHPLKEDSNFERNRIAYKAGLEKVAAIVRNIQLANQIDPAAPELKIGDSDHPIPISMSTMMLLSSIMNKTIDRARGYATEHRQMAISSMVLDMLRYASPLKVDIDGKETYVTVNTTYMNVPANKIGLGTLGQITADDLENNINARGFFEYSQLIEATLKGNPNLKAAWPFPEAKLSDEDQEEIRRLSHELSGKYKELRAIFENPSENADKLNLLTGEIDQRNSKIFKIYAKFNDQMKASFAEDKIYPCLQELEGLMKSDPANADAYLLQHRYVRAQAMFYGKNADYKKMENAFQFQTLYLLSSQQVGQHTEAFCKSAEDRTGWLRVVMLAHQAFNREHGRDPKFPEDKALYDKAYTVAAHELSASLENTKYNSEARGLQVGAGVTNPHVSANIGKKSAKLAKKIFGKKVVLPKPSPLIRREAIIARLEYLEIQPEVKAVPQIKNEITALIKLSVKSKQYLGLAKNYLETYDQAQAQLNKDEIKFEKYRSTEGMPSPAMRHSSTFFSSPPASPLASLASPVHEPQTGTLQLAKTKSGTPVAVEFKKREDGAGNSLSDVVLGNYKDLDPVHIFAAIASKNKIFAPIPDINEATKLFRQVFDPNLKGVVIDINFLMAQINKYRPIIKPVELKLLAMQLLNEYKNKMEQPFYLFQPDNYRFPSDALMRIAKFQVDSAINPANKEICIMDAQDPHYVDAVRLYCLFHGYTFKNESQWKLNDLTPEQETAFRNFYGQRYQKLDQDLEKNVTALVYRAKIESKTPESKTPENKTHDDDLGDSEPLASLTVIHRGR